MLDGLEIKEIKISTVNENKDFRIDSQFYTQQPYKNPLLKYKKIGDILNKSQYGISISMNEDSIGYPIYRMNEIHNMMCDLKVDKHANITEQELSVFKLKNRDVLFNRTNSFEWVGRTGLYKKFDKNEFIFASYLVRFVPNEEFILPEYLTAFLNSKQGNLDIKRRARQSINQTNVNPEEVKAIEIPILSKTIQNKIKILFDKAYKNKIIYQDFYKQAETLLLKELDLLDYQPSKENIAIKSFSKSFGESGRLDSEYYQPKFDDIIKKVKSVSYKPLKKLVNLKKSIEPGSEAYQDQGIPFVRVSNLTKEGITAPEIHLSPDLFSDEELGNLKPKKNTILLSKDGTVGIAYAIKDETNIITSGALLHLTLKTNCVLAEYLTLVLNSIIVQMQSERDAGGSIIKHWKPSEIERVLIPIVDLELQTQITEKIKTSFKLKTESKQLLELAKQAVELAIEKDENEAIKLIEAYEG